MLTRTVSQGLTRGERDLVASEPVVGLRRHHEQTTVGPQGGPTRAEPGSTWLPGPARVRG